MGERKIKDSYKASLLRAGIPHRSIVDEDKSGATSNDVSVIKGAEKPPSYFQTDRSLRNSEVPTLKDQTDFIKEVEEMIRDKYENKESENGRTGSPERRGQSQRVKRSMFTQMREETAFLKDLREDDMLWSADAENGFLSFSKMKYVTNQRQVRKLSIDTSN